MTVRIDLNAYLASLNIATAPVKQVNKKFTVSNTECKEFLNSLDALSYNEVPSWIDDVISGACGQVPGTQKFSPAKLFNMLRALDVITTDSVHTYLNRRAEALGDTPCSDRYTRYVTQAVRCGSQAITHHKAYQPLPEEPKYVAKAFTPLPYTDEEMGVLKRLSLTASFADVVAYETELKTKYNLI